MSAGPGAGRAPGGGRGPVVDLLGVEKTYLDFWGRPRVRALHPLTLALEPGEVLALLGPNGAGKSTTIKLILGLLAPTRGRVAVFGGSPRASAVRARVGYLPEETRLHRFLDARETLELFGRLHGLPRPERRRRTDELIAMVGLEGAADRPVGEMSKGMARRIGLAVALVGDPDLLVLDEPTSGLDPLGVREIKELIAELRRRGRSVLLCTHLLDDVEDLADRIAILYGGRLQRLGPTRELLARRGRVRLELEPPAGVDGAALARALAAAAPGAGPVEVSTPADRLEALFRRVVEEAARTGVTAGARAGGPVARFLGEGAAGPANAAGDAARADARAAGGSGVGAGPVLLAAGEGVLGGPRPGAGAPAPARSAPAGAGPARVEVAAQGAPGGDGAPRVGAPRVEPLTARADADGGGEASAPASAGAATAEATVGALQPAPRADGAPAPVIEATTAPRADDAGVGPAGGPADRRAQPPTCAQPDGRAVLAGLLGRPAPGAPGRDEPGGVPTDAGAAAGAGAAPAPRVAAGAGAAAAAGLAAPVDPLAGLAAPGRRVVARLLGLAPADDAGAAEAPGLARPDPATSGAARPDPATSGAARPDPATPRAPELEAVLARLLPAGAPGGPPPPGPARARP